MEYLVAAGANVNTTAARGTTPLDEAIDSALQAAAVAIRRAGGGVKSHSRTDYTTLTGQSWAPAPPTATPTRVTPSVAAGPVDDLAADADPRQQT